jgi:hypothetical protein
LVPMRKPLTTQHYPTAMEKRVKFGKLKCGR